MDNCFGSPINDCNIPTWNLVNECQDRFGSLWFDGSKHIRFLLLIKASIRIGGTAFVS